MKEPHARAAGSLQLALVLQRMDLGDDAAGVGMGGHIAHQCLLETGASDAVDCRIETARRLRVSDAVGQELQRLKGLYDGFTYRELVRIIYYKLEYRIGGSRTWGLRIIPVAPC